jgi:hypothetical protein
MNGNSPHDPASNAERLIDAWADLSARSRPRAGDEPLRSRVEVVAVGRHRSRNALAGLAALLVVVLVAAVGFSAWRQSPVVAPSPSATATGTAAPTPSPSPSASPRSVFAPPTAPPLNFGLITNIGRIDAMNGWAYGWYAPPSSSKRELLMTNDGGATWRDIIPPQAANPEVALDIEFSDANRGWLLGDNGPLWWTADGGRN